MKLIMFDGEWKDDIKVKGILSYRNGDKYEGTLLKDEPHGQGVYSFARGDEYRGDFVKGWIEGSGTYTLADATKLYTGQWDKAKKHGIGELRLSDGSIYRGSFKANKFNGLGLQRLPDNALYQGNYENNQRVGLQLISYAATGDTAGNTAEAEYQDDYADGLFALHEG